MVSVLAEAARSECAPSMRAMETTPATSLNAGEEVALARANGTSRRVSGWAGEKVATVKRVFQV